LQHFKLLKAQKEFLDKDSTAKEGKKNPIGQKMLAEENRNKKVAEQMKLFNTAFKEGKYLEAESYAMRAQELDPDNAMAAAAVSMAKSQRALVTVKGNKSEKEKFFLDGLNDTDKFGQALTIDKPLDVNESMTERRSKRTSLSALTSPQRKSAAEREIENKLNTPVNLSFKDQPLREVLEDIRALYQINIVPDVAALEAEGISLDRPVTLKVEQISLKSYLNLLLRNVHLTWVIKDEVLQITTESQARGKLATVTYQVTDLVLPVENHVGHAGPNSFNPLLTSGKEQGMKASGQPTPIGTPLGLNGGTPVGSSTGSSSGQATVGDGGKWNKRTGTTTEEALIRIITSTIEPQSWSSVGGAGTIEYHPLTMSLVVNQTPNIQEQVADLLNNLRRLLDQEVALEIKLISIAEDFYERIGLDFNMNIKTDRNTAKFEPMITSGNYKPAGYINDPYFRNMVGGITPAGSFTSDLDIPINQNSFNLSNPAFGNYFGAPGGGINMGLAFLSDIQVFLFLEAAQGDTRTNVMQAPKLTLFNGQTATLNVGDTQFFVTGVNLQTLANGNVAFEPEVQGYFNGIQLTIQAIISADRRTVRLSPNISMQNLAPGPVNLFPVVVPIFPQPGFNQPNPADPITFTQLIQQPVIQSVTVQTTVAVPDGGTVLMGGLKRLSEARNEYGPPILSKIPYINRLFRNTGYGREATSLLMMITPRIIIQEEEEQIQTNFRPAPQVAP
ncbi:MAG: type II secretion system protein GspD, partial [Planctomycetota bacterium]